MKYVWTMVNNLKLKISYKNMLFLTILTLAYAFIGAVVWLLAGKYLFHDEQWLLCFIGYPAVFLGFYGGMLYLYNHDFP